MMTLWYVLSRAMWEDASSPRGHRDVERRGLCRLRPDPLQDETEVRTDRLLHAQLGHCRRDRNVLVVNYTFPQFSITISRYYRYYNLWLEMELDYSGLDVDTPFAGHCRADKEAEDAEDICSRLGIPFRQVIMSLRYRICVRCCSINFPIFT